MKRELNKALLRKVRNKILRVPEAYDQHHWGKRAPTPCGTRACIAGHALIESGFCTPLELNKTRRTDPKTGEADWFDVQEEARRLLGLSQDQASALFDPDGDNWKEPFEENFRNAKTKTDRARVAADYLNDIIRTGEI